MITIGVLTISDSGSGGATLAIGTNTLNVNGNGLAKPPNSWRHSEPPLCLGDPVLEPRLAPQDADRDLAALAGRARPRTQPVALDDLDEIAPQDPLDFSRRCHSADLSRPASRRRLGAAPR